MKKLTFLLLIIALAFTILAACREGKSPADGSDTLPSDTSEAETEKDDDPFGLDEALQGWFEYGGALVMRDKYEYVGT
ncbi:MAG: hypothetical protein IJD10_07680, partial [Clostridia bacterium]|nr:hypothetical protein [Clostridia bacterium]